MADVLPVTSAQVREIKHGFYSVVTHHKLDADLFWQAWPTLKAAIEALPNLDLWRHLPDEFRWTLVPQMQMARIPLPEDFLRINSWLLDLNIYMVKDKEGGMKPWKYDYGFEVERRNQPR